MANDIAKVQLPNGTIADIRSNKLPYGQCSTAAATANKTVNIGNAFTLEAGTTVIVNFSVTNTAAVANLTLNVNSTGAKAIKYRNGNLSSADTLAADRTYQFVYDGTYWQLIGDLDTNTAVATGTNSFVTSSSFSWSAGTTPTLGTAIAADDITSWSQGTLPTVTLSEAILTFSAGTLPSLSYSAKSIPNVTSVGTTPSLSWSTASAVTSVGT